MYDGKISKSQRDLTLNDSNLVLEEWMVSQIALHTNATFNSFQLMQVEMLEDLK